MLHSSIIPQFIKTLSNLSRILDKGAQYADSKKAAPEVLWNSRLALDQFHLTRQIQIACDTAKLGVSRLTGKDAPKHDDQEKTLGELKTRIEETIGYLHSIKSSDFNGAEERRISQPRWEGKYLLGIEYVTQHLTPNFYFHVTTAYSILRHNGVDIGKKDYLGEMPYKQP